MEYIIYIVIAIIGIICMCLIISWYLEELKNKELAEEKEELNKKQFYKNKYPEIFEIFRITNNNIFAFNNESLRINNEIAQMRKYFIYAPNERVEQKIKNEIKIKEDFLKKIQEKQKTRKDTFIEKLEATNDKDFIYWFKNFYAKKWF